MNDENDSSCSDETNDERGEIDRWTSNESDGVTTTTERNASQRLDAYKDTENEENRHSRTTDDRRRHYHSDQGFVSRMKMSTSVSDETNERLSRDREEPNGVSTTIEDRRCFHR